MRAVLNMAANTPTSHATRKHICDVSLFFFSNEQIADDVNVDQVPSTQNIHEACAKAAREFYARRLRNCHLSLGPPCLYLEAEGAMGDNCESVRNTRRKTMPV